MSKPSWLVDHSNKQIVIQNSTIANHLSGEKTLLYLDDGAKFLASTNGQLTDKNFDGTVDYHDVSSAFQSAYPDYSFVNNYEGN